MGQVLHRLGVSLSVADELAGKAHGILRLINGSWEIVLPAPPSADPEHLSPRHRFTVAHELGHMILYNQGVQRARDRRAYWQIEDLCNAFAGQLLISDVELDEAFPRDADISARELLVRTKLLARRLLVSFEAAGRRVTTHVARSAFVRIRVSEAKPPRFVILWATENERWLESGRGKHIRADHALFGLVSDEQLTMRASIRELALPPTAIIASQWTNPHLDVAARIATRVMSA